MSEFEQKIHGMFDHIWDCEINHPIFNDTVGDLMHAVIQCYELLQKKQCNCDCSYDKPKRKTDE